MSTKGAGAFSNAKGGRNLVLLSDGTGMEIRGSDKNSNVLRLFRMLKRQEGEQRVFYDPGIGTVDRLNPWTRLRIKLGAVFGLATGQGLDDSVLSAYNFLMENYQQGDRIYLFGFSRGAYTMRVVAGFLHVVGLLNPDQKNLLPYAYTAYKQAGNQFGGIPGVGDIPDGDKAEAEEEAKRLGVLAGAQKVPIHFLGCWDAVNSVVVPRSDRFFMIPSIQKLPYTRANPSVVHFRHACAIDERRRMFRLNKWLLKNGVHESTTRTTSKQVWFPGCHGDVGGGHEEGRSGLAKNALVWMVEEATEADLLIDEELYKSIALGEGSDFTVLAGNVLCTSPDSLGPINESLTLFWKPLEFMLKGRKWKEWDPKWCFLGFYIPWAEPRPIPEDHELHASVQERMKGDPTYRPPNVLAFIESRKDKDGGETPIATETTPLT